jgi:hypothetical protein
MPLGIQNVNTSAVVVLSSNVGILYEESQLGFHYYFYYYYGCAVLCGTWSLFQFLEPIHSR